MKIAIRTKAINSGMIATFKAFVKARAHGRTDVLKISFLAKRRISVTATINPKDAKKTPDATVETVDTVTVEDIDYLYH
ncbi:MAG: hypothetical protein GC204_05010 [Chloroflexi bacterium]|nr:hypothetical protein [Chloroflexota bacterium]